MIKKIEIDFSNIADLKQMHTALKQKFGFPDFYGENVNALIDCWSDLRDVGDAGETMCDYNLEKDEMLVLECRNISYKNSTLINQLLVAIEAVNKREISWGNGASLLICPV